MRALRAALPLRHEADLRSARGSRNSEATAQEWSAADAGEDAERYRRYSFALVEEEQTTIELACPINLAAQTTGARGCVDATAGSPAHEAGRG